MKNTSYVYANKALESAVKELKSSFFDIFYHSQGTLLMLMTQLDELGVDSEALKEEAVDLINSQGTLLSESMSLVEELIRSIKKIDNNGKKIDKFNRSYAVNRGKNFTKVEGKPAVAAAPATKVKTEPVTEVSTEVQTEPVTEAATEVQTEPVSEVATEVQTESVVEAATEVQTEPVAEAATEVQTESVTEASTEVKTEEVVEETTEVSTTLTGLEIDPNAPVEEVTEPPTEKPKKYIADTPEGVTKDLKQALITMPGMEGLKFDANGRPDFSSILPQDVLDEFNSKFGFQVSVKKTLADMDNVEYDGSTEATVDLPFAVEPVIPTPAPPAPPAVNSVSQSELTTEAQTEAVIPAVEIATEAQTEAVIPAVEVATETQTEAVIPAVEIATEAQTEAVIPAVEVTTEAQTEAVIPAVENATEVQTELSIPGVQVAMPVEESTEVTTEAQTEAAVEAQTEVATELSIPGVQVAMPTEGEAVEGQILPFGEVTTEVETEVATEVQTEAQTEEETIRKFNDQSTNVKAILVSDNQYNKLVGSRVTQEALLTFKRVLPEKGHSGTHIVSVEADAAASTVPSTDNMTAEDKNRTIEAMMADANNLYNAGKVAEAQALYDKISEINKTLVKG